MNKQEFLTELRKKLQGLPSDDIEERLSFYGEMIDDKEEDGLTEEEAVKDIGTADEISEQIIADISLVKIVKERIKPQRQLKAWEIILLACGSPLWLALGIAAAAVTFSLYATIWALLISFWAAFIAIAAAAVLSVPTCIISVANSSVASGLALLAIGIVCAGLSVFAFYGCKKATKSVMVFTKKIAIGIKKSFVKKEEI